MDDSSSQVRSHQNSSFAPVFLAAALLVALWVVFVWTANVHEHIVGLFAVIASFAFTRSVARTIGLKFHFRLRDLLQAWRIPWYIVNDTCQMSLVLFRDLLGISPAKNLFRVCGFDASKHDPVRMARSTLAVIYTTASPSFIVLGIEPESSRMLFHQIEPTEMPTMTRNLGARG